MRMNTRSPLTAEKVVNDYSEEQLADVFYLYGEMHNSRRIASTLVRARSSQQIETIEQFLEVLKPFFPKEREKKEMAKVFQALRIEVNKEMQALQELLKQSVEVLNPNGRLVVLTYHCWKIDL